MKVQTEYLSEIISVLGILSGVLLGAFLSYISKYGKIKRYVNDIKFSYAISDGYGGTIPDTEYSERVNSVSININMDFLNTSGYSKKSLRNIKFYYVLNNKKFYIDGYYLDSSTDIAGQRQMDLLRFIILNPQEIKNFNFQLSSTENMKEIPNAEWYISYVIAGKSINAKNKSYKIKSGS